MRNWGLRIDRFAFVAMAPLAACASITGSSADECSVGAMPPPCTNGAELSFFVPLTRVELDGASITLCRNDTCVAGGLRSTDGAGEPNPTCSLPDPTVSCEVPRSDPGYGFEVDVTVRNPPSLADGDVYAVTVKRASGESVVAFRDSARYVPIVHARSPSRDCDVRCRTAIIDLTGPRPDAAAADGPSTRDGGHDG